MVIDRATGKPAAFDKPGVQPDLAGSLRDKGVTHRSVFQHMAEKYLDPQYAPEAVAERTGISADRIKRLAAELADVAFNQAIEIDQDWTDFRGTKHTKFVGRPVSFHAMRGISTVRTSAAPTAPTICA